MDDPYAAMQQARLESLRPKGIPTLQGPQVPGPRSSAASFRDNYTREMQSHMQQPLQAFTPLQAQTRGTAFVNSAQIPEAARQVAMEDASCGSISLSEMPGHYLAQKSTQERILTSCWHKLGAMPQRMAEPEHHHQWSDVRTEEPTDRKSVV